jgi:hypothetical protein
MKTGALPYLLNCKSHGFISPGFIRVKFDILSLPARHLYPGGMLKILLSYQYIKNYYNYTV